MALGRESNMDALATGLKVRLILETNPGWIALYETLNG
jgi:hypothetical protein